MMKNKTTIPMIDRWDTDEDLFVPPENKDEEDTKDG